MGFGCVHVERVYINERSREAFCCERERKVPTTKKNVNFEKKGVKNEEEKNKPNRFWVHLRQKEAGT